MERYISNEEAFNDTARFSAIQRIREELSLPDFHRQPDTFSPLSIGIEIEMTWRQAFPEVAHRYPSPSTLMKGSGPYRDFSNEYDKEDKQLRPILEHIKKAIPRVGFDAYWEFSFLPTNNLGVTSAELSLLYDAAILRNDQEYSLHMTVAGIDNDRDAFAFLCGVEQAGGTSPQRIIEAAHSKKGSWARKGKGGALKRRPDELLGDEEVGYEFRTLSAQSEAQMNTVLTTAAELSHVYVNDPEAWKAYRASIEQRLSEHGLPLKAWPKPKDDATTWLAYSGLVRI
jgi:hypothetical protein